MRKMHGVIWLAVAIAVSAQEDWQPIVRSPTVSYHGKFFKDKLPIGSSHAKFLKRGPSFDGFTSDTKLTSLGHSVPGGEDTCSIFKVSMNQELVYQYLEYQKDLPDLKEFTLCMWSKFHNHSDDHPLFSYSVADSPKEILSYIANTEQSSYFTMAVAGHTFYRLNYPLKLNTWYHSCQSWNGKTGEWQVWVNAERVGRGFHNRLVGHLIKGGGIAISGQDQSQLYGNKDEVEPAIKSSSGLLGEITMLQLYHVALTAGKAHKDHKHHHVHHFKHDGTPIDPMQAPIPEPPPPDVTPVGNGAFLIGGQLMRTGNLNIAGAQQPQSIPVQLPNGLQLQQQYINGQLGNRIVAEQLLNSVPGGQYNAVPQATHPTQRNLYPSVFPPQQLGQSKPTTVLLSSSLLNPANVQYIDDSPRHSVFRRDSHQRDKRDNPEKEIQMEFGNKIKRGLVALSDGSIVDDSLLSQESQVADQALLQQSILSGLAGFDGNLPIQNIQKEQADEREPAEAEVKAVMNVCSGCTPEPFKKALVLSWKSTPKKLYSGAHYYKGLPICKAF